MLTCIILNYNDAESVFKLYNKIKNYKVLDHIIIVDNASTDDSYSQLKNFSNCKTTILLADKNGGYGYGNNIGLKYSQRLGATYSIIANPDVDFEEKVIINCLKIFEEYSQAVAIAPKVEKGNLAFKFTYPLLDITTASLLLNKLLKPRYYSKKFFDNKKLVKVDILPGSLVVFDLKKFAECGFYDENIFLYNEEIVVAHKFKQKEYISLLNLKDIYEHYHSVSVNKEFKSAIKLKKIGLQSHYYYLKNYANASLFTLILFKLMIPFFCLEFVIWMHIKYYLRKNKNAKK